MAATDARVKVAGEVVTGIKAIKLYAWEQPYLERLSNLREQELKMVYRTQVRCGYMGVKASRLLFLFAA
jgi:ATP-binding cassette subfamily C (CFTR/MRP) protein 1